MKGVNRKLFSVQFFQYFFKNIFLFAISLFFACDLLVICLLSVCDDKKTYFQQKKYPEFLNKRILSIKNSRDTL